MNKLEMRLERHLNTLLLAAVLAIAATAGGVNWMAYEQRYANHHPVILATPQGISLNRQHLAAEGECPEGCIADPTTNALFEGLDPSLNPLYVQDAQGGRTLWKRDKSGQWREAD